MKIPRESFGHLFALFADDVAVAIFLVWGMPSLGIQLPIGAVIGIISGFVARSVVTYRLSRRALLSKPKTGFDNMSGKIGRVVQPINPEGLVKIDNEVWKARYCAEEPLNSQKFNNQVIVVTREGLTLLVQNYQESG